MRSVYNPNDFQISIVSLDTWDERMDSRIPFMLEKLVGSPFEKIRINIYAQCWSEELKSKISKYESLFDLHITHVGYQAGKGLGVVRRQAALTCTSDYVMMWDDDYVPHKEFAKNIESFITRLNRGMNLLDESDKFAKVLMLYKWMAKGKYSESGLVLKYPRKSSMGDGKLWKRSILASNYKSVDYWNLSKSCEDVIAPELMILDGLFTFMDYGDDIFSLSNDNGTDTSVARGGLFGVSLNTQIREYKLLVSVERDKLISKFLENIDTNQNLLDHIIDKYGILFNDNHLQTITGWEDSDASIKFIQDIYDSTVSENPDWRFEAIRKLHNKIEKADEGLIKYKDCIDE